MSGFDLGKLMETAQKVQSEMARVKGELGGRTVAGESGGGMVSCVVNGRSELVSLEVDGALLEPGNKQMLQDLVVAAVNQGLERARELAEQELARAAGGLPLPPGFLGR